MWLQEVSIVCKEKTERVFDCVVKNIEGEDLLSFMAYYGTPYHTEKLKF